MTRCDLRVLEVLKGRRWRLAQTISAPGGRVDDIVVTFTDAPRFEDGQSYVAFLDGEVRVVGWREGNFLIRGGRLPESGGTLRTFEQRLSGIIRKRHCMVRPGQLDALR